MSPIFVRKVSKKLNVRLTTMCTALVYYQRFYSRQSEKDHLPYIVAMACIFLASKVEENYMNIKDVVDTAHAIRHGEAGPKLSTDPEAYNKIMQAVLLYERIILCTLSFDLSVEHPHKYADRFVKTVSTGALREQGLELMQATFNVLNDAMTTNIPLKYPPRLLAAAAVSFAVHLLEQRALSHMTVPRYVETLDKFEKSGKLFECSLSDIRKVESDLMDFYSTALAKASQESANGFE